MQIPCVPVRYLLRNMLALRVGLAILLAFLAGVRGADRVLLVNGDIGTTYARILFESLGPAHTRRVHVLDAPSGRILAAADVALRRRPQVLHIDGLHPGRAYEVLWTVQGDGSVEGVSFQTFCAPGGPCTEEGRQPVDIVVNSCDRYLDDHDDGLWSVLGEKETQQAGMVHLGDQLYNDAVAARLLATPTTLQPAAMLTAFRNAYREAWSHPWATVVLRRGAHWMLPDDHDVVNNLDAWMRAAYTNATTDAEWHALALRHLKTNFTSAGVNSLPDIVVAGHTAYLEYQMQLHRDLTPSRTWTLQVPTGLAAGAVADVEAGGEAPSSTPQQATPLVQLQPRGSGHRSPEAAADISGPVPADVNRAAMPRGVHFARQFNGYGLLFLDTRYARSLMEGLKLGVGDSAGQAPEAQVGAVPSAEVRLLESVWSDDALALLTSRQLQWAGETLGGWEADDSIGSVMVFSQVPLVFFSALSAMITDLVERDLYPGHPRLQHSTAQLLDLLARSDKVTHALAGDVHVFSHSSIVLRRPDPRPAADTPGAEDWDGQGFESDQQPPASGLQAVQEWWRPPFPPARQRRVITQLVSSGFTYHSSTSIRPHIGAFFSVPLYWGGNFNAQLQHYWHSVYQGNNYLVLTLRWGGESACDPDEVAEAQGVWAKLPRGGASAAMGHMFHKDTYSAWRRLHGSPRRNPVVLSNDPAHTGDATLSEGQGESDPARYWRSKVGPSPAPGPSTLLHLAEVLGRWLTADDWYDAKTDAAVDKGRTYPPQTPLYDWMWYDGARVEFEERCSPVSWRAELRPLPHVGMARLTHWLFDRALWFVASLMLLPFVVVLCAVPLVVFLLERLITCCLCPRKVKLD